jgi:hypothetical protein
MMKTMVGTTGNNWMEPLLLIVLSVDGNLAEIIYSTRDWQGAGSSVGKIWRYSTATFSGSRLEFGFNRLDASQEIPQILKWKDDNSGTFLCQTFTGTQNLFTQNCSIPFTRLD